jgi:maltooligosyltrehalose trehalohydrolase
VQAILDDPSDPHTFARCKLDFGERKNNAGIYALHRDLLSLRREEPLLRCPRSRGIDGAILGEHALLLRYFAAHGADRLLLVNLGRDLRLDPAPEPLLAPPAGMVWKLRWHSEDIRYGGNGIPPFPSDDHWLIPGEAAIFLVPVSLN